MFKILDFTEALKTLPVVDIITKILVASIFLTAIILIMREIKNKFKRQRTCDNIIPIILISVACLGTIATAYIGCTTLLINPKSASTDHYSFEITNNKYISIHPTQSRDIRMEFDTSNLSISNDDKTRVNMLEIVSETEDRFICEAKSQSKTETIELMKNEHRFVRK